MIKVKVRTALLANTFIVYDPRGLTLRLIEVGCRHWVALLLVGIEREEMRVTREAKSFGAARVNGHYKSSVLTLCVPKSTVSCGFSWGLFLLRSYSMPARKPRLAHLIVAVLATSPIAELPQCSQHRLPSRMFSSSAYRDWETDRKSTRLNSSHRSLSRMPSSA